MRSFSLHPAKLETHARKHADRWRVGRADDLPAHRHASASITLDIHGRRFGSKYGDAAKIVDSALAGGKAVAIPALLQSGEGLSI